MPLDASYVGRTYPPSPPYEVSRQKIREFADAIGDRSPVYRDPEAAQALGYRDVIAPPTFLTVLTFAVGDSLFEDPGLGLDYSRVVHGEQRFTATRPVVAGDVLVSTVTIDGIRAAGGNDILTTRTEVTTTDKEPVATLVSVLVARGTAEVAS
ncbi:MAG: FAS1-like dehydratase domain-containing protein [Actinomycetales bacterium]